ncbi:hypothetical protein GCM10027261_14240 [Geodermatophilus arenarius]
MVWPHASGPAVTEACAMKSSSTSPAVAGRLEEGEAAGVDDVVAGDDVDGAAGDEVDGVAVAAAPPSASPPQAVTLRVTVAEIRTALPARMSLLWFIGRADRACGSSRTGTPTAVNDGGASPIAPHGRHPTIAARRAPPSGRPPAALQRLRWERPTRLCR